MVRLLLVAFLATFALWVAISLFVVMNRLLDDRRRRVLTEPSLISELDQGALEQLALDAGPQRSRYRWRRIAALFALTRMRASSAHTALAVAILDPDPDVMAAAAVNLRQLGDRAAAAALIAGLRTAPAGASRIAMHLDHFEIAVDDLLSPLLADPRARTRQWAASLLCRYPDAPGVVADLTALLQDPDAAVRKAALGSLGSIRGVESIPAALEALVDPEPFVRSTAARLIGQHGPDTEWAKRRELASAVAVLLGDPTWEVRHAARLTLVQLGAAARPSVGAQLRSADLFARDGAAEVLRDLDETAVGVSRT